jgi:hypothetical protein
MAIFVVVAAILVSIASSSGNVWQQGIAHGERRAAALAVFDRMKQDLQAAAQPVDFSMPKLQMVINPTDGAPVLSGSCELPCAMFWQAPVVSGTSGDLAVVGYFARWVNDGVHAAAPKLCRLYIDPSSQGYTVYSSGTASWSSTITDALITGTSGAPATQAMGYQGQLAENVLGLWVQALDQMGQPITKYPVYSGTNPVVAATGTYTGAQFDSAKGYVSTGTYIASGTTPSGTMPLVYSSNVMSSGSYILPGAGNGSLPAAVEVAIVVIDSRTALRLSGTEKPAASTGNLWKDVNTFYNSLPAVIKRGAEVESTVISINASPR